MSGIRVEGLDELNRALNRVARQSQAAARAGVTAAGVKIEGAAKSLTPVETGALRASAYTTPDPIGIGVTVGFSAEYALTVHESVDESLRGQPRESGLGTYWNPGESQFLLKAVNQNLRAIVDIVGEYVGEALDREQRGS